MIGKPRIEQRFHADITSSIFRLCVSLCAEATIRDHAQSGRAAPKHALRRVEVLQKKSLYPIPSTCLAVKFKH